MYRASVWASSQKFSHAKKRLSEGKLYKCQKVFQYFPHTKLVLLSFRYLLFCKQIIEKGKIENYTAGREYWVGNALKIQLIVDRYTKMQRMGGISKNFFSGFINYRKASEELSQSIRVLF
jgi:hypothetical protein